MASFAAARKLGLSVQLRQGMAAASTDKWPAVSNRLTGATYSRLPGRLSPLGSAELPEQPLRPIQFVSRSPGLFGGCALPRR